MQELGGYTKVVNDCIDSVTDRYNRNPRAIRFLDGARRTLRGQIPNLRTRTQTLLGRVRLSAMTTRTAGQTARRPLSIGTYSELELSAPDLGWKGKVDLLVVSDDSCEILDFKTGVHKEEHAFQIQVYALLWNRDRERNPNGHRADKLTLVYDQGAMTVAAPSAAELDCLATEVTNRGELACRSLSEQPPEARPSPETCRYCGVRQLCPEYWTAQQHGWERDGATNNFTDAEVKITSIHGPLSWNATVVASRNADPGRPVLIRGPQGAIHPRVGDTFRLLDVHVASEDDHLTPIVLTLSTFSEAYRR